MQWIKDNLPDVMGSIRCFIDNNPMKWGTEIMGVPVLEPALDILSDIELIAITCGEGDVIIEQLRDIGLTDKTKVIIPDINIVDRDGKDFEFIWDNIDAFEASYDMLSDDQSRWVFSNILNFKICHDMTLIEEIYDPFETQYFDEQLIKYSDDDVFIDCGSYIGDTIEYYNKWSEGHYKKIYAFEPDEQNYNILQEKYNDDSRIVPIQCGVWEEEGILRFNNLGSGSGTITKDGEVEIKVNKIDVLVKDSKVDFIKMDIEGAEYQALIGARKTIEKYNPVLIISVYHKQDDFIRIPLLIKSFYPKYKMFYRHYRKMSAQETVCYAIP